MPKGETQSITFSKKRFTLDQAKHFLKRNNLKQVVDETKNQFRFRQKHPKDFTRFVTKKVVPGLNLIIGIH